MAAALGALLVLCTAAVVPLAVLTGQYFNGAVPLVIAVPCTAVGVLVARRQPRNPVGWLMLAMAACLIIGNDGGDYSILDYRLGHHLPLGPGALLLNQLWGPGIALFGLVVLLFPDGRLGSVWWRRALWAYVVLYAFSVITLAVATVGAIAGHPIRIDSSGGLPATDNPTGWYAVTDIPANLLFIAFGLCFVARQVLSWRASSGERRQQLKWLMSGAIVTALCPVLVVLGSSSSSPILNTVGGLGWLGFAALPVSIGVGILKYRLYDIDRIISRTLAYAIVTGLLVGVYAGLVLLATQVVSITTPVAVAAATLAAAALFNPLRRRVQRAVDRRFNRARYDADRTIAAFAARLQDAMDLDAVQADLSGVVHRALEPAYVSVWISQRD
ncbi:MAG TPA: hypothetical protein VIX86_18655 [Streptosporangiaceae bacterium]